MTEAAMTLADLNEAVARQVFGQALGPITGSPATDIRAAWDVINAVRAKGYHCDIGSKADGWSAFFWMPKGKAPHVIAHGETAPEAICRAALAVFAGAEP